MYIPIILLILLALYHLIKIRYSAYCSAVYKIYCFRKNNKDLFPKNDVSDCMLQVLAEDRDYKETLRVLQINNFLNIRPLVYVFDTEDYEVIRKIKLNVNEVMDRFEKEFKDIM